MAVDNEWLRWYLFFGGVLGAFVVSMFIICPSHIGFVTTYLCSIFGSMVTSVIFDYVGAFGVAVDGVQSVSVFKVIGIICVLIGAVMVNLKPTPSAVTKESERSGSKRLY